MRLIHHCTLSEGGLSLITYQFVRVCIAIEAEVCLLFRVCNNTMCEANCQAHCEVGLPTTVR
jgi:hypothetical protein